MAEKLIETDEDVEKAAKYGPGRTSGGQKSKHPSANWRRHGWRMSGGEYMAAHGMHEKFGEKGVRLYLRNRPKLRGVRKSNAPDPIDTLYAEIEKARGLMQTSKKPNQFRANSGTSRATRVLTGDRAKTSKRVFYNHFNSDAPRPFWSTRVNPKAQERMGRLDGALKYLGRRSKRNAKKGASGYDAR